MVINVLAIGDVGNIISTLSKFTKKSKIHLINFHKDGAGVFTYNEDVETFENYKYSLAQLLKFLMLCLLGADLPPLCPQIKPFLCTLKNLKSRFCFVFFSIFSKIEPENAVLLGFRQTFFSRMLESFGAAEKNGVDFRKNIFHAYFCCKSAIARDRDFEVKTAFSLDLRANYSNETERWLQTFLTA